MPETPIMLEENETAMNYRKEFLVKPGSRVRLKEFDPRFIEEGSTKRTAAPQLKALRVRMDALQFQLYAEQKHSLLICLQALDAGGKDGVIRHVIGSMNPQGSHVVAFKQPTEEERAHDFLWRVEARTPKRGEVVIFNRSHYEDVLVSRVHELAPKKIWSQRYEQINDFERRLVANNTHVLKFFLHISKEEQLARFKKRLDDPARQWKINESDYAERKHWDDYTSAYEDALSKCSTDSAPWYVIPSDRKWFRNLAVSHIIVDTLEHIGMALPEPTVNLAEIREKYHEAVKRTQDAEDQAPPG